MDQINLIADLQKRLFEALLDNKDKENRIYNLNLEIAKLESANLQLKQKQDLLEHEVSAANKGARINAKVIEIQAEKILAIQSKLREYELKDKIV
jgi:hypothetical protein